MPTACLGSVTLPSCRGTAQHTVLLGQAGQGDDNSEDKCLEETVARQEGGGCQEDKDKVAARLKHKDAEQHQEPA